jgi:succinate dehydrogenase/fumarate reductase flavoprotein subunit
MLLAAQVFGARAGKRAAFYAKRGKSPDLESRQSGPVQEYLDSLHGNRGPNHPAEVKKALRKTAYFNLLTLKSQESLNGIINFVRSLKADIWPKCNVNSPGDLIEVLELQNLLTLAEIEAAVCLNRQESRGPHYRSDFPIQDDQHWLKSIIVKKRDDRMQIGSLALDPRWQSQGDEKMGYWG